MSIENAMNKYAYSIEETKIRNIYLSDLHKILSIYKESNCNNSDEHTIRKNKVTLTDEFGFPISLVEFNKEVIGYAFVAINSSNHPEIHQLFKQGFENGEVSRLLNEYAEKVFKSMFDVSTNNNFYSSLPFTIKRFVDWLNWCQ